MVSPPGPRARYPGQLAIGLARGRLGFVSRLARDYGDVVQFTIGPQPIVLLSHPDHIRDVLVTHARQFHKGIGLERAKMLLGEGLLTSEDDLHLRQRRLAQPAFHRARIAGYGDTMAAYAQRHIERWRDGATVDVSKEMATYTLAVVAKTLFDSNIEDESQDIRDALGAALEAFNFVLLPMGQLLMRFPIPAVRRFRRGRDRLDRTIYRMIDERRAAGDDRGDLLSMLLLAQDTEGDGTGMSDRQLRDEAMTLFLAGHETTANALTWTFYLLSQNPDAEARLHAELDAMSNAPLGAEDLPRLPYTRAVIAESMRLYPPAYILGRRAVTEYQLGEYTLAPRTLVLMSQWIVHRDARWWPAPDAFRPERWMPGGGEVDPSRPKFSFFPFGAGTRVCIGEQFAWMEGILALATMARRWRLELTDGQRIVPQPIITLRSKYGMRMITHAR